MRQAASAPGHGPSPNERATPVAVLIGAPRNDSRIEPALDADSNNRNHADLGHRGYDHRYRHAGIVGESGGFDLFSWAFTAYLLTQAATIPIYGRLADIFAGSAFC